MKSRKFSNTQLATIFISVFGFSATCLYYLHQTLVPIGTSNLFFDDPLIKATPFLMALAVALSVTNVVSKIRKSKETHSSND